MHIKPTVATPTANSARAVSATQQKIAAQSASPAVQAAPADKVSLSAQAMALQNADQDKG